jgi:hypothetical protein
MCKGKPADETIDHLHYPAPLREAARLLGYGERRHMAALLGAALATGLSTFGRENAYFLVKTGSCTAEAARAAQARIVEFAAAAERATLMEMQGLGESVDKEVDAEQYHE